MATPLKIRLNCWVLSEDSTCIFPVEIDRNKNVGALKEAIKEKKRRSTTSTPTALTYGKSPYQSMKTRTL